MHLVSLLSNRPLICLAQAVGNSMHPTLLNGERVLFVRRGWQVGDIVLADVPDVGLVIKRVHAVSDGEVYLQGDNQVVSQDFRVTPDRIQGVMLCRVQLRRRSRRDD